MRPSEIHRLPDIAALPWYDAWRSVLEPVFGIHRYDLLEDAAREASGPTVVVHTKLQHTRSDWSNEVYTLTFDGELFGVYSRAGGSRDEHCRFYLSDREVYEKAERHLLQWRNKADIQMIDVTDDHLVPEIVSFAGVVTREGNGETRMVNDNHYDKTGTLVFDEVAFRKAFDETVRPAFKGEEFDRGFDNADMRAAVAKALLAGIPADVNAIEFNGYRAEDKDSDWLGVVLSTWDGTYALSVPSYGRPGRGFSCLSSLQVRRIGEREAFEDWKNRASSEGLPGVSPR